MGWESLRFKLYAIIDDVEYEVVEATTSFELNAIPRCTLALPVGREVRSLMASPIHEAVRTMRYQKRLQVFLEVIRLGGENPENWPEGKFRIFDGYTTGTGFRRTDGGAMFMLSGQHWLLDLDYGSSLSASSHPMNPSQYSYRAVTTIGGAGSSPSWTPFTQQGRITPNTLATDFWAQGLHPWLVELANEDRINAVEIGVNLPAAKNTDALKALRRFRLSGSCYVPLKLDMNGADSDDIAAAIWEDVLGETYDSFANHTLWNKLVGQFSPTYMFSIVPRVEDALVVPFVPGLRSAWTKTIDAKHYSFVDLSGELPRMLYGLGLFSGIRSRAGASLREEELNHGQLGIGGWFHPSTIETGSIMLKGGPRWLANVTRADRYTEKATGGGVVAIADAMNPGVGPDREVAKPKEIVERTKKLLDAFAHTMYVYELLRTRQGEISGKVRFDIAPGSTVRIEGASERFIPADGIGQPRLGTVLRVTTKLNAEAQTGGTSFHLAHLRNEAENADDATSVEKPPLWAEPWTGCTLLDEFLNL